MISPTQREALSVLAEVVDLSPDIRLGQLFAHFGFLDEDQTGRSLGNIDDEELLAVLYHHRSELAARLTNAPSQANGAAYLFLRVQRRTKRPQRRSFSFRQQEAS